jgi:hypothetical protein
MPKKGMGLLIMWAEIPAELEDELRRWYDEEHLANVCPRWKGGLRSKGRGRRTCTSKANPL